MGTQKWVPKTRTKFITKFCLPLVLQNSVFLVFFVFSCLLLRLLVGPCELAIAVQAKTISGVLGPGPPEGGCVASAMCGPSEDLAVTTCCPQALPGAEDLAVTTCWPEARPGVPRRGVCRLGDLLSCRCWSGPPGSDGRRASSEPAVPSTCRLQDAPAEVESRDERFVVSLAQPWMAVP